MGGARSRWRSVVLRLGLACVLASLTMLVACAGLFVSTEREIVALTVEPFSLLLMPGLLVALIVADQHDFSAHIVLVASACFYGVFFYVALSRWRGWRRGDGGSG